MRQFTLLGNEHSDSSLPTRSSCSSRSVLELLNRIRHFIDNHFVHSEIHAALHEGGTNQNIDATYTSIPTASHTLLEGTNDCISYGLRVLAVDSAAMELLLAQQRHQLLDSSDTIDEYQNGRSRDGSKGIQ